jgi:two-component system cell cycle response regulator
MRVLIAHPDPTSREVLAAITRRCGHSVEVVDDGAAAWAHLGREDRPELALLNRQLSAIDGLELCRKLREQGAEPYLYVILTSPSRSPHDVAQALEAGADDVMARPFDAEELCARLHSAERLLTREAELTRSRAYRDAVLDNLDSGVLLVHESGRVIYGNAPLARLSGTPLADVLGHTRDEFIREHAGSFDDPKGAAERLGMGRQLAPKAATDIEITSPQHRTWRWVAKEIALPEGTAQLELYRDVTEEVERDREHLEQAQIDQLTGLFNRHAAAEIFARELARARRSGLPLSLVLADIDLFKRVNDTFGHNIGDQVLHGVSRAIAQCCRVTDAAIRWGGEEFLVVLPDTALAGASSLAERMRASVQAMTGPEVPPVTISCGVAELKPEDTGLESTLERADAQLYAAKASGRNAVR